MLIPYICHPYTSDPDGNKERAKKKIVEIYTKTREKYKDSFEGECYWAFDQFSDLVFGFCPLLAIPDSLDQDKLSRDETLLICMGIMSRCDEVWVCSRTLSDGMIAELKLAQILGKKICYYVDFDFEKSV
jgi:hypothetical protein